MLACWAPEDFPVDLVAARDFGMPPRRTWVPLVDPGPSPLVGSAALRRFSLISPSRDGLVSVHRLVQAVTLDAGGARAGL